MEFVLVGFDQLNTVRQYHFDAVERDGSRQEVTIEADLGLIRKYGIPLQELPLLCRLLLISRAKIEATVFAESDMLQYVNERAAQVEASMKKRSPPHHPVPSQLGQAWRGSSSTPDKG